MARQAVSSDRAPAALGPYSQAIVAGGFVCCSGTAGIDPATGVAADGIEAQTEQALRNLAAVLEAAGKPDVDERMRAVRTLIAEETGVSMLIGVAVGYELAHELMRQED